MQALLALLKPFWVGIAKWLGIAAAGALLWLQAKKSGEQTIKQQNLENTLKGVQEHDKIEDDIAGANDSEYERMRSKWTR